MADSDNTTETREVGAESVDCPNCGKKLPLAAQPDGSVAAESCSQCFPGASEDDVREQAQQQEVRREVGTDVAEQA